MSGLYDSYVVLDQRATLIIECRTGLSQTIATVEALSQAITETLAEVGRLRVSTPEMNTVKISVIRALETERTRMDALRREVSRIALPADYARTSVGQLQGLQERLAEAAAHAQIANESMSSSFACFQEALGADERIVAARTGLLQAKQNLQAVGASIRQWAPDLYARLLEHLSAVQTSVAQLSRTDDVALASTVAEKAVAEVSVLETEVNSAVSTALERQAQAERREYLVRSVVSVCEELGFQRIDAPAPASADETILRFDTIDRGIVDFRIGIDGKIHTDSAIDPAYCADQFDALGTALADEYGLRAKFTPLQNSEDRPDSLTFEAAEEPTRASRSASLTEGGE